MDKKLNLFTVATMYIGVIMGAIYQTATSTYYGFSITINNTPMKKTILSIGGIVAFIAGLTDFKKNSSDIVSNTRIYWVYHFNFSGSKLY